MSLAEIVETIRVGPLDAAARSLAECCNRRMRSPVDGQPSKPDDVNFLLFRLT